MHLRLFFRTSVGGLMCRPRARLRPVSRAGTALVVDDSPEIVALLVPLLEREGFTVSSATDGEHAVEAGSGARTPDLIILDLALPTPRRHRGVPPHPGLQRRLPDHADRPGRGGRPARRPRRRCRRLPAQAVLTPRAGGAHPDACCAGPAGPAARRPPSGASASSSSTSPPARSRLAERAVELTKTEFDLLAALSGEPGTGFTRADADRARCGARTGSATPTSSTSTSPTCAASWATIPRQPSYVRTVRGVGYRMAEG